MLQWKSLGRWKWLALVAIVVPTLAIGVSFIPLPLRDSDKAAAAEAIVAWIVEGKPVPGFREAYPDAQHMPRQKRFIVVCDFVPTDATLSTDPRVQRVTEGESRAAFEKHRFDETDYIYIELKSHSDGVLVVEFSNTFGGLAGHYYRFEFRRNVWGLWASGKLLSVS